MRNWTFIQWQWILRYHCVFAVWCC